MSEKNTSKPIDVVKFYYAIYKDNETAYNNAMGTRDGLDKQLREMVSKGNSTEQDFQNIAKEHITISTVYSSEVMFAANKFLNAADFYLKILDEELPEEMLKDYVVLKNQEYKQAYSVQNGQFVRNSKVDLPEIPQEHYDYLFNFFKMQFEK
jgi:hypothetical protein